MPEDWPFDPRLRYDPSRSAQAAGGKRGSNWALDPPIAKGARERPRGVRFGLRFSFL